MSGSSNRDGAREWVLRRTSETSPSRTRATGDDARRLGDRDGGRLQVIRSRLVVPTPRTLQYPYMPARFHTTQDHAPRPRAVHFARHSCIAARASPPASAAMPLGASTHSRMQCSPTSPSTTTDSTPRTPRTLPKAPSAALSQRALHDALQSESESELSLIRRGEQAALARINHLKASNIALERNLHLHAASLTAQREMLNDLASKVAHLTQLLSKPGGQHSEPSNPEALYTAVMQLHHRIQRGTTPSSPPKVRGALSPMVE